MSYCSSSCILVDCIRIQIIFVLAGYIFGQTSHTRIKSNSPEAFIFYIKLFAFTVSGKHSVNLCKKETMNHFTHGMHQKINYFSSHPNRFCYFYSEKGNERFTYLLIQINKHWLDTIENKVHSSFKWINDSRLAPKGNLPKRDTDEFLKTHSFSAACAPQRKNCTSRNLNKV